jgi:hypothetical protein
LSETYHAAAAEMRTIGLSHPAGEKLARLLLGGGELSGRKGPSANQADAEVRRSRADDVQLIGSTLVIKNKSSLEGIVTG